MSLLRIPSIASDVKKTARALSGASRPVLIIGSQALVGMTPPKAAQLAHAVTRLGMPTFLGGMARGLLGRENTLQFLHKRSRALREADVIVVAGFPFDFSPRIWPKNQPRGARSSLPTSTQTLSPRTAAPTSRCIRTPATSSSNSSERSILPLLNPGSRGSSPYISARERGKTRSPSRRITRENTSTLCTSSSAWRRRWEMRISSWSMGETSWRQGAYVLRPRRPLSWLDPGVFGTLGVGGGFALGAALSRPDSTVWIVWGDGSSAYSLAEFRHLRAPRPRPDRCDRDRRVMGADREGSSRDPRHPSRHRTPSHRLSRCGQGVWGGRHPRDPLTTP